MPCATCRPAPGSDSSVDRLPFFAYGTLLPGQPNYWLWQEAILDVRPARFRGSQLLDMGNYPMLVESDGGVVKGALVTIVEASFDDILKRLDRLEGFDPASPEECVFCRVRRKVELVRGESATAWLYLGRAELAADDRVIQSGDWVEYSKQALQEMAAWWEAQGPKL